jgi:tRNA pseudouridine38-40 synthase
MLIRWKLTIEYDGTGYCGWQRQDGLPTIQESIETAITKFCGQDIRITTAGRTDSGVHAHGQVCHFDLDYGTRELTDFDLAKAINAHLVPEPITILKAEKVADDFHARFGAIVKCYRYSLVTRPFRPVLDRNFVWHYRYPLNIEAMREGAKHLIGHHDFTSFRDSKCQAKSPIRTLQKLHIKNESYDCEGGMHIIFELEGQSFLHHQCRNIVGTLVQVGRGKIKPAEIKTILDAKDRTKAGMTAPPQGLSLISIAY